MISAAREALLVAANRVPSVAQASRGEHRWLDGADAASGGGLVAIGCSVFVGLYDPRAARYVALLAGHTDRVNAVAWVWQPRAGAYADEDMLVSCASDGTLRAWRLLLNECDTETLHWHCAAAAASHTGSAVALGCMQLGGGGIVCATVGTDCCLRAWLLPGAAPDRAASWECIGCATVPAAAVFESVAVAAMPAGAASLDEQRVLVAAGGADSKVHLYALVGIGGCLIESSAPAPCLLASPPMSGGSGGARLVPLRILGGCTDWVRCLAFSHSSALQYHFGAAACAEGPPGGWPLHLAAASQDGKVRLWAIEAAEPGCIPVLPANDGDSDDETSPVETAPVGIPAAQLQQPGTFEWPLVAAATYSVVLDALLTGGHDHWVTSVAWHPPALLPPNPAPPSAPEPSADSAGGGGGMWWQPPCLLSASMDKGIVLWQPAAEVGGSVQCTSRAEDVPAVSLRQQQRRQCERAWDGVWRPCIKLGGAGAAVAGFYGAQLTADGHTLLAHGYQGSLHTWRFVQPPAQRRDGPGARHRLCAAAAAGAAQSTPSVFSLHALQASYALLPSPAGQGHWGPATDVAWGSGGRYLLSTSADATTRAWGPVSISQHGAQQRRLQQTWVEVGRPQIHGYEMQSAVPLPPRFAIASAGDERVLRLFDAPRLFLRTLRRVCGAALRDTGYWGGSALAADAASPPAPLEGEDEDGRAEFGYVPELGLTNRGVQPSGAGAPVTGRFQADGRDAAPATGGYRSDFPTADETDAAAGGPVAPAAAAAASMQAAALAPPTLLACSSVPARALADGGSRLLLYRTGDSDSSAPPTEEDLVQHSRWPETHKAYGHTHELVALACDGAGALLASAAKMREGDSAAPGGYGTGSGAGQQQQLCKAAVLLWDATSGNCLQRLVAHKMTVAALAFSPPPGAVCAARVVMGAAAAPCVSRRLFCERPLHQSPAAAEYLVSVSKDRSVAVYGPAGAPGAGTAASPPFALLALLRDAHRRIVWSVSWAPLPLPTAPAGGDPQERAHVFATGSRDHTVKVWRINSRELGSEADALHVALVVALPAFDAAVTAVAFAPFVANAGDEDAALCDGVAVDAGGGGRDSGALSLLVAVGLESGAVSFWRIESPSRADAAPAGAWTARCVGDLPAALRHVGAVNKLAWRPLPAVVALEPPVPCTGGAGGPRGTALRLQLASAGSDNSVRICSVRVPL